MCYIYFFKLLSRLKSELYDGSNTHAGSADPLSSRSVVKPRIPVRHIGCAPYSGGIETSGHSGKREEDRKERSVIRFQQQSFHAFNVFFCLGDITKPHLGRAECFAKITCQNTYFLPPSKFLFGAGCENVSLRQG